MSAPWRLVHVGTGEELVLPERGTLVLGSDPARAGLVVSGPGVDASHCALGRLRDGGWAVQDLGAAGGTRVNGEPVGTRRLLPGDVLSVGAVELEVRDPAAPAEEARPAAARRSGVGPEAAPPLARLGGFRLERRLGRGGMGDVYLAIQESLDRPVALKVLSPRLAANAEFVARFQREARAAAALQHPNVVVVYDVGESDGLHYLAMEFVSGGTLEERVARHGPLPWRLALTAMADAARGLVYAEEHGIVHRDVKPANLMMDGSGTVKLADLGLATSLDAEGGGARERVFGTPHFISPEQARGEPVDHRSDLYSLGATVYRLLTGRTPFAGETQREILRGHLFETPAPIEGVPRPVSDLVLRCLAKSPADRPRSASELLRSLQAIGATADAAPPAPAPPRHRPALVVAPLLLAGLGAGAWLVLGRGAAAPGEATAGTASPAATPPASSGELAGRPAADGAADDAFLAPAEPEAPAAEEVERELRILELEGEIALRDLPPGLPPEERVERLREIATRYAGTSVAPRAEQEIARAQEALARRSEASLAAEAAFADARRELCARAGWPPPEGELPDPARSLAALLPPAAGGATAPPMQAGDAGDAATEGGDGDEGPLRRELLRDIATRSQAALAEELARADEAARRGDFDAVAAMLMRLSPRLALPAAEALVAWAGEPVPELEDLRALEETVRDRLASLPEARAEFAQRREREDRARLESALGTRSKSLHELSAWKPGELAARLRDLSSELRTELARERALALAAALEEARLAVRGLGEELAAGHWRRRSISDPRPHGQVRDVVAVGDDGLVLGSDGGNELVPWEATGLAPDFLGQLFHSRLDRDYTPKESAGIVLVLRLVATAEAARRLPGVFDATLSGSPSPFEAAPLSSPFAAARAFAGASGADPETLREEEDVARGLERVLESLRSARWSEAEIRLEGVLADHQDALLVLLASDGDGGTGVPASRGAEGSPAPGGRSGASAGGEPSRPDGERPTAPDGDRDPEEPRS